MASRRASMVRVEPAAKRPKSNPMFAGVVAALRQAKLPEAVRDMLTASVPRCLGTPAARRHEAQAEVVEMIEEAMAGVQAGLQAAAEDAGGRLDGLQRSGEQRAADVVQAEGRVVAAAEVANARKSALAEAAGAFQAAKAKVQEASESKSAAEKGQACAKEQQDMFDSIVEDFQVLVAGTWGPEGPAKQRDAVLPCIQALNLESALLVAAPAACAKASSDRTAFDLMVLQSLQSALASRAAQLAEAREAAASSVPVAAGQADAARVELAGAQARQEILADEASRATAALEEAEGAVRGAKAAREAFEAEVRESARQKALAADELENYATYNMGCLELLRDSQEQLAKTKAVEAEPVGNGKHAPTGGA